jgi:hypothetical protein
MVQPNAPVEIYQLHILLLQVNPPIWRRLHVRSDSSIATLHDLLQIGFNWSDFHLHRFVIRGKEYGVSRTGCTTFTTDARKVLLSQFGFRVTKVIKSRPSLERAKSECRMFFSQVLPTYAKVNLTDASGILVGTCDLIENIVVSDAKTLSPRKLETGKNRGLRRLRIACLLHPWIPTR